MRSLLNKKRNCHPFTLTVKDFVYALPNDTIRYVLRTKAISTTMKRLEKESRELSRFKKKGGSENMEYVVKKGKKTYSDEIKKRCVELAKQGKSLREIAKIVNGPNPNAVRRYIAAANKNNTESEK